MSQTGTTGADMIAFLQQAARENKLNRKTAGSVWSAADRILRTVYGEPGNVDITKLDVKATLEAFGRKEAKKDLPIGAGTMTSYQARLRMAVRWYLAYLKDPATWHTVAPDQARREAGAELANGFVDYQIPIRGAAAHLIVPRALTAGEADRLAAFVRTLVEEVI